MKLSARAERLLSDVEAAERICRNYSPKDPARDPHYREASNFFAQYAENYRRFHDDYHELLLWAEKAEREAEAEPATAEDYGPGVRRREMDGV